MISTRVVDSVTETAEGEWDRLVDSDNFFHSHAWLTGLEHLFGRGRAVVASEGGRLVGVLPTWPGEHGTPGLFSLADMFDGLPGPWRGRFMWLGAHRCVSNRLAASGPFAVHALLEHVRQTAARYRLAGAVLPYVPVPEDWFGPAHPLARAVLHSAQADMAVPPGGLAEYLDLLNRDDRNRRRAELRKFHSAGNTVSWEPVAGRVAEDAARLIAQNRSRYGSHQGADLMRRSFAAQRRSGVLNQAVAGVCRRRGRMVAVLVCYRYRGHLYARYAGFDYAAADPALEYLVLVYCLALDFAAANGFTHYHLSTSALEIKARRGATLTPLAALVVPTAGDWLDRASVQAHNERFVACHQERFGHRPHVLGPAWAHWSGDRARVGVT